MYPNKFDYGNYQVEYFPFRNVYVIYDLNYMIRVGFLCLQEGPGWVINLYEDCYFLDESQTQVIADLLHALNSTLEN